MSKNLKNQIKLSKCPEILQKYQKSNKNFMSKKYRTKKSKMSTNPAKSQNVKIFRMSKNRTKTLKSQNFQNLKKSKEKFKIFKNFRMGKKR